MLAGAATAMLQVDRFARSLCRDANGERGGAGPRLAPAARFALAAPQNYLVRALH
jgi:hypothetical protein